MKKSLLNAAETISCRNYINEGNENSLSRSHSVCRCDSSWFHMSAIHSSCWRFIQILWTCDYWDF